MLKELIVKIRDFINKRPAACVCGSFFLSLVFLSSSSEILKIVSSSVFMTAFFLLLFAALFIKGGRAKKLTLSFISLAVAAASFVSYYAVDYKIKEAGTFDGKTIETTVRIESSDFVSDYAGYYTAVVSECEERKLEGMKLSLQSADNSMSEGDAVSGNIIYSAIAKDDEDFQYSVSDGIFLKGSCEKLSYISHEDFSGIRPFFRKINNFLSDRAAEYSKDGGNLVCAVLLGNRDRLDGTVKRDFSRLGISHLFAVSGLHLSIVLAGVDILLRKTRLPFLVKKTISLLSVLAFMALVGFSLSVMRAGIMHILCIIASMAGRKSDSITSLSISVFAITVINPYSVFDTALLLSASASLGCIIYSSLPKKENPDRKKGFFLSVFGKAADMFRLTAVITVITLPVMLPVFSSVSLFSPLANIIFIPLVTLFLYLSVLFLLLCGVPYIGPFFVFLIDKLALLIEYAAEKAASLKYIVIPGNSKTVFVFILLLFLSPFAFLALKKKHRKKVYVYAAVCIAGIAVSLLAVFISNTNTSEIYYAVNKKNNGFVIRQGNCYDAVDISSGSNSFQSLLFRDAKEIGATEIETYILTHYHSTHIQSLSSLADRAIIRKVALPRPVTENDMNTAEKLIKVCKDHGIEIIPYSACTKEADVDGITLRFYRTYTESEGHNYNDIVLSTKGGPGVAYLAGADTAYYDEGGKEEADVYVFGSHPSSKKGIEIANSEKPCVFSETAFSENRDIIGTISSFIVTAEEKDFVKLDNNIKKDK